MKQAYPLLSINLLIFTLFILPSTANADVLVLKNGDRITGTIKRVWDGEISIEPDYSDEFTVDLPAVDHIISDRSFEIELQDGREVLAHLSGVDEDGRQLVSTDTESTSIALADILELDEPDKEFDWESHIDFSSTFNSGNTNTSSSQLRADLKIEIPDHRHLVDFSFFHEDADDTSIDGIDPITTKEQTLVKYAYNWFFNDPWFMAAQTSYETDPIMELESRVIVSVGIGRDIWNTPRRALSMQLGVGGQSEEISSVNTDSTVATWGLRYSQRFFSDDLDLFHNHTITANIDGRTNTSYKTTTGLRFEITDLLYANVTFDYDYETEPADGAVNEDSALMIGVGVEF